MRKELEYIKVIEQYLRNELSVEDKIIFEEKLKLNLKLQEEVKLQRKVVEGIERIGVKKSIQSASKRYNIRRKGFFMGLFAVIIASGVLGINYINNTPKLVQPIVENITEQTVEKEVQQFEEIKPSIEVVKEEKEPEMVSFPQKQFQVFNINSSEDAVIKGREGTEINFKANSFNVPKNSSIKIRLKEYYKMSDIAFTNLTTETSDGQLLETGGMIYVDAFSQNKEVNLKTDTFFDIKFPFEKKKKDMILFDGKSKNRNIVWEKSKAEVFETIDKNQEFKSTIFTIVEQMPEFQGSQGNLMKYLAKNLKYPIDAKAKNISGKVFVNFTVTATGKIENVKVLRGVHSSLDREAIRVLENMPNWKPGMQRGKAVDVSYNLPINFTLDGNTVFYSPKEIKSFTDSLNAAREENIFGGDTIASKKSNSEVRDAKSDISFYALSGAKLGWINCDRFAGRGNLNLIVKLDNRDTDVKIIFHSMKSLIVGNNNGFTSRFGRVPKGEKVTIFAVKYVNDKPFVCLKEFITSRDEINLEFKLLTKEKLRDCTAQINKI